MVLRPLSAGPAEALRECSPEVLLMWTDGVSKSIAPLPLRDGDGSWALVDRAASSGDAEDGSCSAKRGCDAGGAVVTMLVVRAAVDCIAADGDVDGVIKPT